MKIKNSNFIKFNKKNIKLFNKGNIYKAKILKKLDNNYYKVKIKNKILKAFTKNIFSKGDLVFLKAKKLSPMPVLELITSEDLISGNLKNISDKKGILKNFFKNFFFNYKADDSKLEKEFFKEIFNEFKNYKKVLKSEGKIDNILGKYIRDKLLSQQRDNFVFFSFPFFENDELKEGYISYKTSDKSGVDELRVMVELSEIGKVLTTLKKWDKNLLISFYYENSKLTKLFNKYKKQFNKKIESIGFNLIKMNLKESFLQMDPVFFINFNKEKELDIRI